MYETDHPLANADGYVRYPDIDLDIDGDRAAVAVVDSDEGRVPRRLVGQDGKVLEALQELTRLAVQSATGDRSRLMLDVAAALLRVHAEVAEIAADVIALRAVRIDLDRAKRNGGFDRTFAAQIDQRETTLRPVWTELIDRVQAHQRIGH